MKQRTRWKTHEVFKAICITRTYLQAIQNAKYSRSTLLNEANAQRWLEVAEQCEREWIDMGLAEIIGSIKRTLD